MALALLSVLFLAVLQAFASARAPPLPPFVGESNEKVCYHEDEIYEPWEKFADKHCTGWCTCDGKSGSVMCVSLCPPAPRPMCSHGTFLKTQNFPSADLTGRCKCKRQVCSKLADRPHFPGLQLPPAPPEPVHPECKSRDLNKWFIDSTCSGMCKCSNGGIACVSLCPPMGIMCPPGTIKEPYDEPMDEEGRCFCKRERCSAKIGAWLIFTMNVFVVTFCICLVLATSLAAPSMQNFKDEPWELEGGRGARHGKREPVPQTEMFDSEQETIQEEKRGGARHGKRENLQEENRGGGGGARHGKRENLQEENREGGGGARHGKREFQGNGKTIWEDVLAAAKQ